MIIIIIICRCLITNAYPSTAHHVNKVCWYLFYMHMYTQTCTLYTHVQNICIWPHMYTIIVCAQMCSSCVLCAYTVTIRGVLKNTKHKNLQERKISTKYFLRQSSNYKLIPLSTISIFFW